jgi:hypothetical protein
MPYPSPEAVFFTSITESEKIWTNIFYRRLDEYLPIISGYFLNQ